MKHKCLQNRAFTPAQKGMTLIEVLVTVVLISVGLLGVAALQITTLKGNQEAYVRSQASELANNILDRLRANQAGFLANEYEVDFNGTCAAATIACADLIAWQAEIDRLLPGAASGSAAGRIQRTAGSNVVTVTLRWSERADKALNEAAGDRTFQTRTEI